MRGFKFKSLTMRIWMTFTMVILVIILCLSLLYIFAFRFMDTKAKAQDLLVVHNILINSNLDRPIGFGNLRNLRDSSHFIYTLNSDGTSKISDIEVSRVQVRTHTQDVPHIRRESIIPHLPALRDFDVMTWFAGFITDGIYEREFNKTYKSTNYIFIISQTVIAESSKSYLISYMPNHYDNSLIYYTLIIGCMFIAVGFIAAKLVANYISKPLSALEKFTVKIAAKDWNEPIILKNDDEIGRLAISMNKMQDALKRADEEEKMFLQSISHDLKTPVMVIMSHADAIIDGIYVDTLNKTAQIIKHEAINLNKKIKQLLYLNTLDYVLDNQPEVFELEFDEIVKCVVDRFEILGGNFKWNLFLDKVKIKGNHEKLTVAIENILDNAIRYAKSEISVSLKTNGNKAYLEIFNDGKHIGEENLKKIFDNMYKEKTGNFGLGLAITKKIIVFFGGVVHAQNKENGVSFIIEYPLL